MSSKLDYYVWIPAKLFGKKGVYIDEGINNLNLW